MKPSFLLVCVTLGLSLSALAAPFQDFPGSIPLRYERQAAVDLVDKGHPLTPDQARALYESGTVKDLSLLDPSESSVLWKNQILSGVDVDQENIGLSRTSDDVVYVSDTQTPDGFSFIGSKTGSDGQLHSYQVLANFDEHNILLRKALLRKIGYNIPPVIRVAQLRVHFKGAFSKKEFVRSASKAAFMLEKHWIISGEDTDDDTLTLQDVVVFDGNNDTMYNLARAYMNDGLIQGRRLMNALLVPYNLVDVPEKGLNLFSWQPGTVTNTQLILNFRTNEYFSTSYEDARWITRRILKLTRQDWQQIVAAGTFPSDVSKLLLEKLISRRNYLREVLNLQNESQELAFDPKVSAPPHLKEGRLMVLNGWPGYAVNFTGDDAQSPMSDTEMWGFFRSKFYSNVISNLINIFNSDYMPQSNQTDLAISIAAKKFAEGILKAHGKNVPVSLWKQDLWDTHIIASREIVTGNYLGTDNVVQLADSVGVAADLGYYLGTEGLPTKVNVSGKAQIALLRTYTHLKPVHGIKAALKEPFRNMMVPWLKQSSVDPLETLLSLEGKQDQLGADEFKKQVNAALDQFKQKLGVGESLIIQTSLAPNLSMGAGYGLARNVQLLAQLQDSLTVLSRIQIYRKDDNTIQIYKDPAKFNTFNFALALQARIQVVQFDWAWIKGAATTNFYTVDLTTGLNQEEPVLNPNFFKNVGALRAALRKTDLDPLNQISKPWKFEHNFSERDFHFDLLWWRYLSQNSTDRLRVTTPQMQWKDFIRRTIGKRSGNDYENLSLQVLNELVDEYTNVDPRIQISSTESGNPGDTFKGKSVMRQVVLEGQINQNGQKQDLDLENMAVSVNYRWKGWDISTEKAEKIIKEITDKYGQNIFPPQGLNETKKIQFYAIEVKTSLYQAAFQNLMALNEGQWRDLYTNYLIPMGNRQDHIEQYTRMSVGYQNGIKRALATSNSGDAADKIAKLINLVEGSVKFQGFVEAIGGINNLYLAGDLRGFRVGDENGDQPIFTRTLGQIGSNKPFGPLAVLENQIGVSEGELLIYWLLKQL